MTAWGYKEVLLKLNDHFLEIYCMVGHPFLK